MADRAHRTVNRGTLGSSTYIFGYQPPRFPTLQIWQPIAGLANRHLDITISHNRDVRT